MALLQLHQPAQLLGLGGVILLDLEVDAVGLVARPSASIANMRSSISPCGQAAGSIGKTLDTKAAVPVPISSANWSAQRPLPKFRVRIRWR